MCVCPFWGPTPRKGKRAEEAPGEPTGGGGDQEEQRGREWKLGRGSGKASGGGELSQGFTKWATLDEARPEKACCSKRHQGERRHRRRGARCTRKQCGATGEEAVGSDTPHRLLSVGVQTYDLVFCRSTVHNCQQSSFLTDYSIYLPWWVIYGYGTRFQGFFFHLGCETARSRSTEEGRNPFLMHC